MSQREAARRCKYHPSTFNRKYQKKFRFLSLNSEEKEEIVKFIGEIQKGHPITETELLEILNESGKVNYILNP